MSSQHTSTYISLRASYNKQITVLVTHSWPCTVLMQMLFYILKQNKMARPNDINIYIIRFTFDRGEPFVPVSLCRFILIHIRSFEQRVVSPASNCLQFWKYNIRRFGVNQFNFLIKQSNTHKYLFCRCFFIYYAYDHQIKRFKQRRI